MFKRFAQIAIVGVLAGASGIAFAEEKKLTTKEISAALTGVKVAGVQDGVKWTQSFGKSGSTTYSSSGRAEIGSWRADGDQYCSQWPPQREWSCYDVIGEGDAVTFIPPGGGKPWPAKVIDRK